MSVSLLAAKTDCASCVTNNLSLNRLRKWNLLAVCACCALGMGGLGLSMYLYNKHKILRKSLDDLEAKLESINEQLEDQRTYQLERRSRSRQTNTTSTSRRSSLRSESDYWNTPNTSPIRVKSVEFCLDDIEQSALEHDASEPKTICEDDLILSDNRSLELLQMQTLNDINMIREQNREKYKSDPTNSKYCIDYIKSLYVQGETDPDINTQKELKLEAYEIAKQQLKLNPDKYLTHKWYAIVSGRATDFMSINEKVKVGFEFKDHLDIAINMNDSDYLLYYLRGRWTFKMCNLSWAERYGVRVIFGKVPNVDIEQAMSDFMKHEELHKNKSKGCSLHIAKCLINRGETEEALNYLNVAIELPTRTIQHGLDNEEIDALIKQYS